MNTPDYKAVAGAMVNYGGGFVMRLGAALAHADPLNARRIAEAFPELIEKYMDIAERESQ